MENKAWDGIIAKKVSIINSMEHDDTKEEVVQTPCTSQCAVPSTTATHPNTNYFSKINRCAVYT
jgi:hypothetical protein